MKRILVTSATDGIFNIRGDHTPLNKIVVICRSREQHFAEGVITIVDVSPG